MRDAVRLKKKKIIGFVFVTLDRRIESDTCGIMFVRTHSPASDDPCPSGSVLLSLVLIDAEERIYLNERLHSANRTLFCMSIRPPRDLRRVFERYQVTSSPLSPSRSSDSIADPSSFVRKHVAAFLFEYPCAFFRCNNDANERRWFVFRGSSIGNADVKHGSENGGMFRQKMIETRGNGFASHVDINRRDRRYTKCTQEQRITLLSFS